MNRLSGLDASFLAMESRHSQLHTLKFAVFGRDDHQPVDSAWFIQMLTERIRSVPCYGQHLVAVPWGLHHPVLVDDPNFDPLNHVHVKKVGAPGGRRQRDAVVAEICRAPLDRTVPLWEAWILEGLADGQIGCLLKLHHALADGRVAANQIRVFAGQDLDDENRAACATPPPIWQSRLVYAAVGERITDLRRLPALVRQTRQSVRDVRRIRTESPVPVPGLLSGGPHTRFRNRMSAERVWGTMSFPLVEIVKIAKANGVSVNDVLLAATSGAVRTYLRRRGELPSKSLTVAIPVDTSKPADAGALRGNKWAFMVTTLATDVNDPVQRLRRIHETTAVAKQIQRARGDLLERWWQYVPMNLIAPVARFAGFIGATRRIALPTLGVSNVRGPGERIQIGATHLAGFYSVGPLMDGIGLNLTAWSVSGHFHIAICSAVNIITDPEELLDALNHELRVLSDPADLPQLHSPSAVAT